MDGQADLALALEPALEASEQLFTRRHLFRPPSVARLQDPVSTKPMDADRSRVLCAVVTDFASGHFGASPLVGRDLLAPSELVCSGEAAKRLLRVDAGEDAIGSIACQRYGLAWLSSVDTPSLSVRLRSVSRR